MSCTHGYFSNYKGGPVPRFDPMPDVRAALQAQDPDLDCVWKERFGGRLCIVSKTAYAAEVDRDELGDDVVVLILTADDGGPRQLEWTDLVRIRQCHLDSWDERWTQAKENNAVLDKMAEIRFNNMLAEMFKDWEKTTVYAGEHRSPRNGSSDQYICEHGKRNVKCPLCRPDKKMVFRQNAPSGEAFNGYDTLDLRDDPDLLRQVQLLTRKAHNASKNPARLEV